MGREDYLDNTMDAQPPMCGGAVFKLFRTNKQRKSGPGNRGKQVIQTFDQRPVGSTNGFTPSVVSSDFSFEDAGIGPKTALLSEHPRRGLSKHNHSNDVDPCEEIVPYKFDLNESVYGDTSMETTSASSSESEKKKTVKTNNQKSKKLDTGKMSQIAMIQKLEMEKKSFEAEALLLREEMYQVREQLQMFQAIMASKTTSPNDFSTVAASPATQTNAKREIKLEVFDPEKKSALSLMPIVEGNEFEFAEWEVTEEESHKENTQQKTNTCPKESTSNRLPSFESTESYWMQALQSGPQEFADESDEEHSTFDQLADDDDSTDDDSTFDRLADNEDSSDDTHPLPLGISPKDVTSSLSSSNTVPGEPGRGIDPPEATKATSKIKDDELTKDMEFVHNLLEKYQSQLNKSFAKKALRQDNFRVNSINIIDNDFEEEQVQLHEQEAVVKIENMKDVDRSYSQRQVSMERAWKAFDSGKLQEAEPTSHQSSSERTSITCRTRNTSKNIAASKIHATPSTPPRTTTTQSKTQVMTSPVSQRSVRFSEKYTRGAKKVADNPAHDGQGENKSSRANMANRKWNEHFVHKISQTVPSKKQDAIVHPKWSRPLDKRSDTTQISNYSNRSERSHQSEADDIEYSTSMHNSLFWSQSTSHRSERASFPAQQTVKPIVLQETPVSSSDSSDVMDGLLEDTTERRSRQESVVVAEVREASQIGRSGGLYKIQVTSTTPKAPHSKQAIATLSDHKNQPPQGGQIPMDRSSNRSERSVLRGGHAGEYKQLARRLI